MKVITTILRGLLFASGVFLVMLVCSTITTNEFSRFCAAWSTGLFFADMWKRLDEWLFVR